MINTQNLQRYSLIALLGCFVSCSEINKIGESNTKNTYPGKMAVLSKYHLPIRIVDCEGLGGAQPRGIIIVNESGGSYPQAIDSYPRLRAFPKNFTIRWRSAQKIDDLVGAEKRDNDFLQTIELPKNLRGAKAQLLFVLDQNNEWSCELMSEEDLTKPYKENALVK